MLPNIEPTETPGEYWQVQDSSGVPVSDHNHESDAREERDHLTQSLQRPFRVKRKEIS